MAPSSAMTAATRLIVSCRAMNFFIMLKVCLPQVMVVTIDANESSNMTISDASFAV